VVPIAYSTFNALWNKHFKRYAFHTTGPFAKCEKCLSFKLRLSTERRPDARAVIEAERQ
jgi:hypothetical protein